MITSKVMRKFFYNEWETKNMLKTGKIHYDPENKDNFITKCELCKKINLGISFRYTQHDFCLLCIEKIIELQTKDHPKVVHEENLFGENGENADNNDVHMVHPNYDDQIDAPIVQKDFDELDEKLIINDINDDHIMIAKMMENGNENKLVNGSETEEESEDEDDMRMVKLDAPKKHDDIVAHDAHVVDPNDVWF